MADRRISDQVNLLKLLKSIELAGEAAIGFQEADGMLMRAAGQITGIALKALLEAGPCTVVEGDKPSITCHRCFKTSYNANDVKERFCGYCRVFHDLERCTEAPAPPPPPPQPEVPFKRP